MVSDTGASVHCTNDMVGAHTIQKHPSVTTLGQHSIAAIASKLVNICGHGVTVLEKCQVQPKVQF